jgi:hypothetical protein
MLLPISDSCPKCGGLVVFVSVERAPGRKDLALRHYVCPRCGRIEVTPVPLTDPSSSRRRIW